MKDFRHSMGTNPAVKPAAKAPAEPKYSHIETHWFMVAVELLYKKLEAPATAEAEATYSVRSQKVNVMIQPKKRKITAQDMGDIRHLALLRMQQEYKVDKTDLVDFIVLNIMYLGLMSEHTYFTEENSSFERG